MSNRCRICRKSTRHTNAKQLFKAEQNALILQIELITGEWLNYERGWPTYICIRCEDELNVAAAFRGRCIQTQQELRLELITGEPKSDHLDPLDIEQGSVAQNDKETTRNKHFNDEVVIKDEHLDDDDSLLMLDYNSVKTPTEIVENKNDKQNEVHKLQEKGEMIGKQLQTCKDQMGAGVTSEKGHLRQYTDVKNFECNVCKKCFSTKIALRKHDKMIHSDARNYHCELCDEWFSLYKTLKQHNLSNKHKNRKNKKEKTNQRTDAKSDESIADEHISNTLSKKEFTVDELFKDGDSTLIPNNEIGIKSSKVVADMNKKKKLTKEGLLPNELELRDNRISDMDMNDTPNQIEKDQVTLVSEKLLLSFSQNTKSRKRSNLENKNADFVCDICGKNYKSKCILKNHLRRHTGVKDFECSTCRKRFSTKYELTAHEIIHTNERNYHCELCDESFKVYKYLKHHERSNKHISKARTMTDEQLKKVNGEPIKENFICDQCGKQFPYKKCFMEHLHRHRGIKDFECNTCKKRFALETELQKHLDAVHAGIKRFSCKYCDMKFKYTQTKTYHIRKFHTFQLPFKCRYCEKAFISGQQRKSHENVHSSVRNYHCKLCNEYFKQYVALKLHERTKKHKSREDDVANNKQN